MTKTKQVFISHAKEDTQFAHRLADDLRRLGVQVWIAPESILGGEGWVSAIERGLEESSHMVVVLTPAALESRWVKKETDVAIAWERKGLIQLIPLDVEPCKAPPLLGSYQMVSFRPDYDAGLSQLAGILDVRVTSVELPEIEIPEPSPQVFLNNSRYDKFRETTSLEKLPLEQIANDDDLEKRYPGLPLGEGHFNGVPFVLSTKYFSIDRMPAHVNTPAELRLDEPLERVGSVHVLIIGGHVYRQRQGTLLEGVMIGRIQLIFHDKSSQEKKLIVGENIREWVPGNNPGELVDNVTEQLCQVAWKGKDSSGKDIFIDHLEIPVQERHRRKALERMLIFRDVQPGTPKGILSFSIFAITLECWWQLG
jgi:hypothetical protein